MGERKPVTPAAIGLMAAVCLVWAFQQIGLKSTAAYAAPVLQIGLRSGIAALCVLAVIRLRHQKLQLFGRTAFCGAAAGLLFAIEFFLVGEALRHTSASHVIVFLYTAPIFAALGLALKLPQERLSPLQWGGILLAAGGIAYAFLMPGNKEGAAAAPNLAGIIRGDGLALLGGAVWGATTVLIRTTRLSVTPAAHTLFYQLATAFVLLTGTALVTGQGHISPVPALLWNLAFQALVVSFVSFLTWFWLLTRYRASQLGVFSFMSPLMGVMLGVLLLDEPLTIRFIIGAGGVLVGIVIVSAAPWLKQLSAARAARGSGLRRPA